MAELSKKISFADFISVVFGSKEVGLALAKDKTEFADFTQKLEQAGFQQPKNIADIPKIAKVYFSFDDIISKEIYDIVVQYPSGQVEIFDKQLMQSRVFSPDYKNSALVLLMYKDSLIKFQEQGFDILAVAGPAFQS